METWHGILGRKERKTVTLTSGRFTSSLTETRWGVGAPVAAGRTVGRGQTGRPVPRVGLQGEGKGGAGGEVQPLSPRCCEPSGALPTGSRVFKKPGLEERAEGWRFSTEEKEGEDAFPLTFLERSSRPGKTGGYSWGRNANRPAWQY